MKEFNPINVLIICSVIFFSTLIIMAGLVDIEKAKSLSNNQCLICHTKEKCLKLKRDLK